MAGSFFTLLSSRRFAPLMATQFLGAFNDNLYKNALIMLVLFGALQQDMMEERTLVTLAAGLFILPYVLFSATAGQLADRYEKSRLIFWVKVGELVLVSIAVVAFALESVILLLAVLFLIGTQATFFSPLKYSIVPDHLHPDELLAGNALLEAGTFLAILTGTITGGLLVTLDNGVMYVSILLVLVSVLGVLSSLPIPKAGPFSPQLKINWNLVAETKHLLGHVCHHRILWRCVLGISWFWFLGASFFSQFPAYTKDVLHGNETVVTTLLTAFSVGIALRSVVCHHLLKGEVTARYVPISLVGIALFSLDLAFATPHLPPAGELQSIGEFITEISNLRILFDFIMIAVCGGIFIVPLNTLLQMHAPEQQRSRVVAANNLVNAVFMVASSLGLAALLQSGVTIPEVFMLLGITSGIIGGWVWVKLRHFGVS